VLEGIGGYAPPRVVDNAELCARLDTDEAWIESRLGVRTRHVAETEGTVALAAAAAERALDMAGGGDVEAVVLATTTPDRLCPASAPEVAARLGFRGVMAFDLSAACAGFVHALAVAGALIVGGGLDRVLVAGADVFTTLVDPADRLTAVIFGDGAGACVLRSGHADEPGALGPFDFGSDGSAAGLGAVYVPGGGALGRLGLEPGAPACLRLDGPAVFARAVAEMTGSSLRALRSAGWAPDSVDRLVAHQANARIIRTVAANLGLPPERCPMNLDRVGNTVAASVPLALGDAHDAGLLAAGDRVLLTSIGAGLVWGSTVLTWPALDGKARIQSSGSEG
jgi:3-oxoacyl-[acyl-carrier-protein] synthase III